MRGMAVGGASDLVIGEGTLQHESPYAQLVLSACLYGRGISAGLPHGQDVPNQ